MEWIRHIACPLESDDLFATAESEKKVSVWSLKHQRKISEFNTGLDDGGRRLSLIDGECPLLIVGAYHRHGLCAYTLDGTLLWQRKDLKRVQQVESSTACRLVTAGLDSRALQVVRADTGETVRTFREATEGYFGRENDILLTGGPVHARMVSLGTGATVATYPLTKTCMHTAQSNDAVLLTGFGISEIRREDDGEYTHIQIVPAYLACYHRHGKLLWQTEAQPHSHYLRVSWCEGHQRWYAVQWQFTGGPYIVSGFDQNGVLHTQGEIEHVWECEFLAGGTMVVTSAGQVLSLPDLQLVWQFADPPPPPKR